MSEINPKTQIVDKIPYMELLPVWAVKPSGEVFIDEVTSFIPALISGCDISFTLEGMYSILFEYELGIFKKLKAEEKEKGHISLNNTTVHKL